MIQPRRGSENDPRDRSLDILVRTSCVLSSYRKLKFEKRGAWEFLASATSVTQWHGTPLFPFLNRNRGLSITTDSSGIAMCHEIWCKPFLSMRFTSDSDRYPRTCPLNRPSAKRRSIGDQLTCDRHAVRSAPELRVESERSRVSCFILSVVPY